MAKMQERVARDIENPRATQSIVPLSPVVVLNNPAKNLVSHPQLIVQNARNWRREPDIPLGCIPYGKPAPEDVGRAAAKQHGTIVDDGGVFKPGATEQEEEQFFPVAEDAHGTEERTAAELGRSAENPNNPAEEPERERQEERLSERTGHAPWPRQVQSEPKTGTGDNGQSGLHLHQGEEGGDTV
ncbi:hypothetical protein NDU88_007269 [Pleurodeles waltl]|uniref:Uncharacterized protein n=1 Tax=Pleurodeles waltl TaxID=8319 RepID=A0AAV7N3K9_PLEWA|nr:hypothetical protein NDU88_007269 [Pleurodeles waltl]